ncbi:phosphatidylinositol mannoside acyltransferase [Serinibacter salmoneus]|uniref:KDO2-lipid IV(A) lauroyltransferase n=1 Tax=Serinibacter salmoneus TaxID=556530 RepID=A0A2A9CZP4_9MICO|nr:phosphatidylinositol mannoside acyltransferase [Serinibacter salmoneus]PFG19601.1 KDO2-lipid IV(A) lauroyltransferase [Serinibacter salmoneus]
MRLPTSTDLYAWAWRIAPRLPEWPAQAAGAVAADVTWLLHTDGVKQLERNLARIRPGLSARELRRLSRAGMRSYMRYFVEAFQVAGFSREKVLARVRPTGVPAVAEVLTRGDSVVMALGHSGNWDLAGAWAAYDLGPVLTVAEKLPDGLYEQFVAFRNSLGIEIVPLEDGNTFRTLLRRAGERPQVVPLLSDRDLTRHGVEVQIAGLPARVAAGPAALSLATGFPLVPVDVHYERLRGEQRRAAGSRWGLVIRLLPAIATHDESGQRRGVQEITQDWVDVLMAAYAQHPQDWHMLQKVFHADLDMERLARSHGEG